MSIPTTPVQPVKFLKRTATAAVSSIASKSDWPVALVCMPFVSILRPSLQICLLKSLATKNGFQAKTLHLNMDFAQQIGVDLYEKLVHHRGRLFGDWLFSPAAFGSAAPAHGDELLDAFPQEVDAFLEDLGQTKDDLLRLRQVDVPRYLDQLEATVPWGDFRVVGFTSTFQQNTASFALAARLKKRFPNLLTIFGGANFDGEMGEELTRSVDCIDFAAIGEADEAFPEFLQALVEHRDPAEVPGIVTRRDGRVTRPTMRPPFEGLNENPIPDFQEYFDRAAATSAIANAPTKMSYLPFESARGCWWGQKHHCTFCGLNGSTMKFRAKSPERVLAELAALSRQYRCFNFEAVDNIVDPSFFKTFFPTITSAGLDYQFFYEVKSNLTRAKLKTLSEGGVSRIQPGIESLSSPVLSLMRKGVSAIQNVNTLRWAGYYGINVGWNMIFGFPGEQAMDYDEQLALLPNLFHLQPPEGCGRIWMERYSPIFFDRNSFPAQFVKPEASYSYVYPPFVNLNQIAYFFDYSLENTLPDATYLPTRDAVKAWRARWEGADRPALRFWCSPGYVHIEDLRDSSRAGGYTFEDDLATLYAACSDMPRNPASLRECLGNRYGEADIAAALDEYCARGLMMRDQGSYLSLALPASSSR